MTTRKTLHEKPRQRQPEGGADGCATPRRWSPCCRKVAIAVAAAVVCMATVAEPEPARQPVWPEGRIPGPQTNVANCLFEDGRSDWRISIRENADLAEVFAAETLQTNILKISGALLPIVREKIPGAPKALVVSPSLPKGPDDLVSMQTAGGCIFLEGNSPRATVYAASRFLQDYLGARWFWPEDDGEYLPRLRRYEIPAIDWSSKPAFRYRDLSQCCYSGHVPTEHWLAKLGMNMVGNGGKATADLFIRTTGGHLVGIEGEKMFAEHPDWFSLIDGRRVKDGVSGCWSNPGFTAAMVEKIKNHVRDNRSEILRAFPYDTCLRCQCPGCTKNPDRSSRWFDYYSHLGEEVKKEFLDIRMAAIAYQEYSVPPSHPVKGLEWVEYCQYDRCYIHQLGDTNCPVNQKSMEVLGRWREMAPLGVYGYHFDIFADGHFVPFWNMLADEARTYARMGFVRMKTEMPISRPKGAAREKFQHIMFRIPYYVYAQLTWNPDANVDDILRDWCEHVYGAGAGPMHEYLVRFAENWDSMKCHVSYFGSRAASIARHLISPEFLKFAWGRIEAAEAAVKASGGGPDAERALREIGTERALLRQWETTWELSAADRVSYVPPHLEEEKPIDRIPTVSVTDLGDKDRRAPHQPTDIRLWWTDEAFHIHVDARDDDIAGLMAGEPGRDIPFWNHDNVEIFLGVGDGIYRQLGVTPSGGTYDAMGQDASWNPAWTARTAIGEDRWTADISLPFASFCGERPKNGDTWQLSVIRNDKGHRACGFPSPVYRDLALMASVVFSDKARGQRLVWLEPKKGADNRNFMARRPQLYARGWNATCFIGAEEAEKADVASADLIFVGSGQDNLSEKFYRERVIPAVEGGAVLFIDSYYGIGDLQRKFGDETFKVGYRDDSAAPRRATWFTTNTFATIPNRIRTGTTPPGVLLPESPESWEILAMHRQKSTGLERPYMMVRPYGKGSVFLTAPLYGELLDCIDNAWEYNTVLKRD